MFEDLYDAVSFLWSKRWPTVEAEITAVEVECIPTSRLSIAYKFFVGEDGPYTGVSSWEPSRSRLEDGLIEFMLSLLKAALGALLGGLLVDFLKPSRSRSEERVTAASKKFRTGQRLLVRYRPDDASVNAPDRTIWEGL